MNLYKRLGIDEDIMKEWLDKYEGDREIMQIFAKINQIGDCVFDKNCHRIDHIKCEDGLEGIDEDKYILVYRK